MIASIDALTPGSRASKEFRNVDEGYASEQALFRGYDVEMLTAPTQVGMVINGSSWRWLTECQVSVFYPRMESRAEM